MLNNTRRGVQIRTKKEAVKVGADAGAHSLPTVESLQGELAVLQRRLESKTEALVILSNQLEQARLDRDQFRGMVEQLRSGAAPTAGDAALRLQLERSRQHNTQLEQMIAELSQKMEELCGDIMVLRRDAARNKAAVSVSGPLSDDAANRERRHLVERLEELQRQCEQQQRDLEQLLDEKEELVTQRDAFKSKAHRLNHQLSVTLAAPDGCVPDLDALVTENRQLHERLACCQAEVERLTATSSKYKRLLEARKSGGVLWRSSSESAATVLNKRQVEQKLLGVGERSGSASLAELRSLCAALLDQLQDKCTALTHQRRANRLLAEHCAQLRHLMHKHGVHAVQPADVLMHGYSANNVDRESEQLLEQEQNPTEPQQGAVICNQHCELSERNHLGNEQSSPDSISTKCSSQSIDIHPVPSLKLKASGHGSISNHSAIANKGPTSALLTKEAGATASESASGLTTTGDSEFPDRSGWSDEEIVSLEQLDRYIRSGRGSSPLQQRESTTGDSVAAGTPPGASSGAMEAIGCSSLSPHELPPQLDSLYQRALQQLVADEREQAL